MHRKVVNLLVLFCLFLPDTSFAHQFSLKGELKNEESFFSHSNSKLNPNNRIGIPTFESITLLSLEPKVTIGEESFLKGLFNGEYIWQKNSESTDDFEIIVRELYFSTAYKNVALDMGRERIRWGVGYSASPTDVVTTLRRPGDPEDRLNRVEGTDIVKADLLFESSSLSIVYLPDLKFKDLQINEHSVALRYYTFLKGLDLSIVFLGGENKKAKAGINSSYVIGEAIELHGELLWSRRKNGLFPDYFQGTNFLYNERPYKSGDDPAYFALFGGQYTIDLEEAGVLNIVLEYYRNGDGLSKKEIKEYNDHIIFSHDLPGNRGYSQLLWAAEAFRFPLGIDYLFYRMDYLFFNNRLRSELNTFYSLNDGSLFLQPIFTWDVNDSLSLYVRGFVNQGPGGSEADISPIRNVFRIGGTYSF